MVDEVAQSGAFLWLLCAAEVQLETVIYCLLGITSFFFPPTLSIFPTIIYTYYVTVLSSPRINPTAKIPLSRKLLSAIKKQGSTHL